MEFQWVSNKPAQALFAPEQVEKCSLALEEMLCRKLIMTENGWVKWTMPPERTEPKATLALWNLLFLKKPPAVCLTSGLDRMGLKSSWNDKVENVEAAPLPVHFFRFEMADNQFNRLHRERVGARDCGTWSCSFPALWCWCTKHAS